MRLRLFLLILYLLISSKTSLATTPYFVQYPFYEHEIPSCPKEEKHCFVLEELIRISWDNSFDIRTQDQTYYQSYKQVNITAGAILPHVSLGSAYNMSLLGPIDFLAALFGFALPPRWFNFFEAKHLKEAEKWHVKSVYADNTRDIILTQLILFQIHHSIELTRHYQGELEKLLSIVTSDPDQIMRENYNSFKDLIVYYIEQMVFDRAALDNLAYYYPLLGRKVNLMHTHYKEWDVIPMVPRDIKPIEKSATFRSQNFVDRAVAESTELEMQYQLIEAMKKNKGARKWGFFDPEDGGFLGFGYKSTLDIVSSKIKVLEIGVERGKADIYTGLSNLINNIEVAVAQYFATEISVPMLKDSIFKELNNNLERKKKDNGEPLPLDTLKLQRIIDIGFQNDLHLINSYFNYYTLLAGINRFSWYGDIYDDLKRYVNDVKITK